MADHKDADAFTLLYFLTAKQHKKRTIWPIVLWKLNHAPKVGQLYRSSDVGFRALNINNQPNLS